MVKKLSNLQIIWLNSRGGRTANDVVDTKDELLVFMSNGKGEEIAMQVPSDNGVKESGIKSFPRFLKKRREGYIKNII